MTVVLTIFDSTENYPHKLSCLMEVNLGCENIPWPVRISIHQYNCHDQMHTTRKHMFMCVSYKGREKKCGVVEQVKHNKLSWFGHLERIDGREMTNRV